MIIRSLEWADIPDTVDLAQEMHAESAFSGFDFDGVKMACQLGMVLTQPDVRFCSVAVTDGKIVGALFGHISEFIFGPQLIASDFGWFVQPKYRGTSAAVRLLKEFHKWAEANNACEVSMGITTGVHPEKTDRLFKRLGYRHVGGLYKRNV